ncbi:hypothetical protein [Mycoplasma leonicaptivi]|uniref:hypothetical protein n=1 Tax=Mycoplasma leonicaptivi TaxID=36742 RepID=UPI0004864AA2|nr:hypothetical protein [Mycoplasma leonicaptivi]
MNNKKSLIILYSIIAAAIVFLIIGIILGSLGGPEYTKFIELKNQLSQISDHNSQEFKNISESLKQVSISLFVYGTFMITLGVLLGILAVLSANSIYNKKLA